MNPSAPDDVLPRIAAGGSWPSWWRRPLSPDLLRALAHLGDENVLRSLAGHPGLPADLALQFAHHPDTRVRASIADNHAVPHFAHLAADPDPQVRTAMAGRPGLPGHVYTALLTDGDEGVRTRAAVHAPLSSGALARILCGDPSAHVLKARPHIPLDVLEEIAATALHGDDYEALCALVTRPDVTDAMRTAVLARIDHLDNGDPWESAHLAGEMEWLADAPFEKRRAAASSPLWLPRSVVADHADLPDTVASRLRGDPNPLVAILACAHPSTPGDRLVEIVFSSPQECMTPLPYVCHPNFPVDRLTRMASGPAKSRELAAHHPGLDPALLVGLTRDQDAMTAHAAARNPSLPVGHMYRLLKEAGV